MHIASMRVNCPCYNARVISSSAEYFGGINKADFRVAERFGVMKNWLSQVSKTSVIASVAPPSGKSLYNVVGGKLWFASHSCGGSF